MRKNYLFLSLALSGFIFGTAQTDPSWVPQATNWNEAWGVKEISIVNPTTAWISSYDGSGAGTYPKDVAKTTNGGATWTALSISGAPSGALISDIAGIDGNVAYVVTAPSGSTSSHNGIWKTTDGGATWSKYAGAVFNNSDSFANHVYFWDANNGYSGGDPANGKFEMYKTTDAGATWTAITTAPAPLNANEFTYVGVKKVVGDNIWLGTSLGRVMRSKDRGATWEVFASPASDFGGVISSGSSAAFAFADNGQDGMLITDDAGAAFLFVTTDGGENWEDAFPVGIWYPGDIAAVPGSTKTFVSSGINSAAPMGTSYSEDGGVTWIEIDSGQQRGTLAFYNGETGWCGGFSDGSGGSMGIFKLNGSIGDLGVTDFNHSKLNVYPNPSKDVVNFSSGKEITMVNIIDMTGKVVAQVKGTQVNVSSLPAGVYVAQVRYADGAAQNTKIVVK